MPLKELILRTEDLVREHKENGAIELTHPFLEGTVIWSPAEPPSLLFERIKAFAEAHRILMEPELESACAYFAKAQAELHEACGDEFDPYDDQQELDAHFPG